MVSDPPTRRATPRWQPSVAFALSAGVLACSTLLDLPDDPYLVEPPPMEQPPGDETAMTTPAPGISSEPEAPTSPELEIDDTQGGPGTNGGSGNPPGDDGTPPTLPGADSSDAGAPLDAAPPLTPADAALTCPAGASLGPSGRCYVAVQNTLTAPAAQQSCQALGPGWDLAAIHDAATNTFLGTLIGVEAWIGASDADAEGEWRWVIDDVPFWSGDAETGAPVNGELEIWAGNEPNGETGSNCARLVPDPPRWADLECDSLRASLCEGPPL